MKQHSQNDTIVAITTAQGRAGVGVVRMSGPLSLSIAERIIKKDTEKAVKLSPRLMQLGGFYDHENQLIDSGLAVYFPKPHSFTGEDVVELQGHGGSVILDCLLASCVHYGARLAKPGEFSERAFHNNKIDLVQAEAIVDLIDASSKQAAHAAMQSLQGSFSNEINTLLSDLVSLRVYVESAIDFPEEEIDFLTEGAVLERCQLLLEKFNLLRQSASEGQKLRDGLNVVLVGQPNVGKSSLLNALAKNETAIVTDIPGTTRDVLRETILINGLAVNVFDTAGLRETNDAIEKVGIERAKLKLKEADHVLWLMDSNKAFEEDKLLMDALSKDIRYTIIYNKIDLNKQKAEIKKTESWQAGALSSGIKPLSEISLSAKTGDGIELLKKHLLDIAGLAGDETRFIARRRHLEALDTAIEHIKLGLFQIEVNEAGELLAEELHQAQKSMNEITGEFSNDDLLGEIFTNFCIGK